LIAKNELKKLEWFREVVADFGSCMKIARLDGVSVGFVQYAPAEYAFSTCE
jgi:hypothetical protein